MSTHIQDSGQSIATAAPPALKPLPLAKEAKPKKQFKKAANTLNSIGRVYKTDNEDIKNYISSWQTQHRSFVIEGKRKRMMVLFNNKMMMCTKKPKMAGELKDTDVLNVCRQVAASIAKYIINVGLIVEPVVAQHSANYINHDKWQKMADGQKFYYIDIVRCFWRIAYLNDYINRTLYNRYVDKPEYKLACNKAISCIVAPKWRDYYVGGKHILHIEEDKTLQQTVYDNIRHTAYNLMGNLKDLLGNNCIGYTVDGVKVSQRHVQAVKDYMDSHNLNYTVKVCKKIDNQHYLNVTDDKVMNIR